MFPSYARLEAHCRDRHVICHHRCPGGWLLRAKWCRGGTIGLVDLGDSVDLGDKSAVGGGVVAGAARLAQTTIHTSTAFHAGALLPAGAYVATVPRGRGHTFGPV